MNMKKLRYLYYLVIYSILGYLLETIYAIFTKGTFESRKSFLYGPFCIIYGIGAIILIFCLKKYRKKNIKLFFYGAIIGSIVEYTSSLISEIILHVKWWDYKNNFLNINGRTCLYYALCWGVLSILLINYINPFINLLYKKIFSNRIWKKIIFATNIFLLFDAALSTIVLNNFIFNLNEKYNINISEVNKINLMDSYSEEQVLLNYPNMIVVAEDKDIYIDSIINAKKYYYKLGEK